MAEVADLLPQNETVWEKANELTDAEAVADLDATVIWKVKDALLCDERFLAVLGWERSVDIWDETWPLEKKRFVVDQWFAYERLKGTPEGFRRAFSLHGVRLRKVTSPPQTLYARRGWTEQERAAYLAQFQQIRIYPLVPVREFQRGFFVASNARSKSFVGHVAPTPHAITIDTVVREARLYDPVTDDETVLTRREITKQVAHVGTVYEFEDIVLPKKRFGFYVGDHVGHFKASTQFLGRDDAPERTLRTTIQRPYGVALSRPQWTSAVPNARLINIYPDLVRETYVDHGAFLGRCSTGLRSAFYGQRDTAWQHVYERFHIFDRTRDKGVTAGEPGRYVGHARLGMMPFTAELKVEIRGKRKPWEFASYPGQFATTNDRKKLDQTLEATRAFKAGRDTIFLVTKTRRKRQFGDRQLFGDRIVLGAKVEDI